MLASATVASRALAGIDAPEVSVEVHLGPGLPSFHIVGLPDTEVREARDRVGDERPLVHEWQQLLRTTRGAERPETRADAAREHDRPQRESRVEPLLGLRLLERAGRDRVALGVRSTAGDPDTRVVDKGQTTLAIIAAQETATQTASAE